MFGGFGRKSLLCHLNMVKFEIFHLPFSALFFRYERGSTPW